MILLHGGFTYEILWTVLAVYFFFIGIPVYLALFYSLKHTSLYINKVRNKGTLVNISFSLGVLLLSVITLMILGGGFMFFQVSF
ncbi:MAG: hypothetical protein J7604_09415 [Sporocytophaga sp.]|uniref:hypothetical protein n=1 Tax=Sporocytophaga sp. TaxID=2231183 RepID=UPI001B2817AB|nr:hypothetical protein [Sporocytophaga sp.]MBO9700413.1 hypothetical protein [Sporocytophaga sp.]